MMNVVDDVLVIEEKGIYSVEKFLMSRRLMYWQVYLHKTSLVAELILTKVLKRAKELTLQGIHLSCSSPLLFFMQNRVTIENFDAITLDLFSQLDDFDIISALKSWQKHDDFILSSLSKMIINRDLPKIKVSAEQQLLDPIEPIRSKFALENDISILDTDYFIFEGKIKNQAYSKEAEPIRILKKDKTIEDVVDASDQLNIESLSKLVTKYYICYPKSLL